MVRRRESVALYTKSASIDNSSVDASMSSSI